MDFDFLNIFKIFIPVITLIVVCGLSTKLIIASGLRAVWAAIIYFGLLALYLWYTRFFPNLRLYTYILDNIKGDTTKDKILWFAFFLLIFIIQFFMLFDYSIKNMGRSFNGEAFTMTTVLCIICNLLLSLSFLSQIFMAMSESDMNKEKIDNIFNNLKKPFISFGVVWILFTLTYFIMFILRQFFSM